MALTPQSDLRSKILTVLAGVEGGSATRADVLSAMDAAFHDDWTPEDLDAPDSRPWDKKWKNQASFERADMARDGLISGAVKGVWTLTPAGLAAARALPPAPVAAPDPADAVTLRAIKERRGQEQFRARLLTAYGDRCAFSGCDATPSLEAAHITPHASGGTYATSNGLLLRADLHTLFDLHLLTVDLASRVLLLHPELFGTTYGAELAGRVFSPPAGLDAPDRDGLVGHRRRCGL